MLNRNFRLYFLFFLLVCNGAFSIAQQLDVIGNVRIDGGLDMRSGSSELDIYIGYGQDPPEPISPNIRNYIGYNSGAADTAFHNSGVGSLTLNQNTNGRNNLAAGYAALKISNSNANTAIGSGALSNQQTGIFNTAIGYKAGTGNNSGSFNTLIGSQAGRDQLAGKHNILIGQAAGLERSLGENNVIIGHSAGRTGSGSDNVVIGDNAGRISQGSNNVIIGSSAAIGVSIGSNILWIDNSSTSTPLLFGDFVQNRIGINCTNPQATVTVVGDIAASGIISGNENLTCSSDIRFKHSIKKMEFSLSKLDALRPVSYKFQTENYPERSFPKERQIGLIAQEVARVYPELVYTSADGFKSLDYNRLTTVITRSIQDLWVEGDRIESIRNFLEDEIERIEEKLTHEH